MNLKLNDLILLIWMELKKLMPLFLLALMMLPDQHCWGQISNLDMLWVMALPVSALGPW
jgi:hypothetical protein